MIFLGIERIATEWARRLALLGGWLLLAVAVVTASDALLRDFLGRPLLGTFEATELVLAAIIFFGLPYTSLTDGHVSVDFLTGRLGQRTQYAIIAINAVICAVLFGVIVLQMMALAAEFRATQRTTITMRIPIFPCIVPVTVTAGLAALGFVVQAIGAALRAWRPGLSQKLFHAANIWLGHRRGGLAMATVGACAGFAAICGSSVATGATMCSVALPEMRRYGYADSLSTGSIAAGGTLGILIPPSVIFVLYGIMTEQSIGKLLLAGIIPGLVLTLLFFLVIALVTAVNPVLGAAGPPSTWRQRLMVVKDVWEVLVLFIVVIGGLYAGLATPVESAAFGAVGALLFGLLKRTLTWRGLLAALDETVRTTAMVFFIVIGADLFGYFMALSQMPMRFASWLSGLHVAPVAVLWAIIATYILLGALMDELAMILLTVPIFFPVVTAVGYDPIWFGVVIVVVVQIGLIAPPVGLNVFVIGGMARDVPLATIYRGIMPFLVAQIVLLVLLMLWPGMALLLPGTMQ